MVRAHAVAALALLVAAAPAYGGDLDGKVVVLDPGHNGGNARAAAEINRTVPIGQGQRKACDTTGTATRGGYSEASLNLDVARRARRALQARGATVRLTRERNDGVGPCIDVRSRIGNRAQADAVVSIHADGGPPGGHGFHVILPTRIRGLTDDIYAPSRRLGLDLRRAFRAGARMPYSTYAGSAGLSIRSDLGGLRLSDVPKVFLEMGNMRNGADARRLITRAWRQDAADAIAAGIAQFALR